MLFFVVAPLCNMCSSIILSQGSDFFNCLSVKKNKKNTEKDLKNALVSQFVQHLQLPPAARRTLFQSYLELSGYLGFGEQLSAAAQMCTLDKKTKFSRLMNRICILTKSWKRSPCQK